MQEFDRRMFGLERMEWNGIFYAYHFSWKICMNSKFVLANQDFFFFIIVIIFFFYFFSNVWVSQMGICLCLHCCNNLNIRLLCLIVTMWAVQSRLQIWRKCNKIIKCKQTKHSSVGHKFDLSVVLPCLDEQYWWNTHQPPNWSAVHNCYSPKCEHVWIGR